MTSKQPPPQRHRSQRDDLNKSCGHLHLGLVRLFCVEPEALPGPGPASASGSLLSTGLADGGHEQRLDADTWVVDLVGKKRSALRSCSKTDRQGVD